MYLICLLYTYVYFDGKTWKFKDLMIWEPLWFVRSSVYC